MKLEEMDLKYKKSLLLSWINDIDDETAIDDLLVEYCDVESNKIKQTHPWFYDSFDKPLKDKEVIVMLEESYVECRGIYTKENIWIEPYNKTVLNVLKWKFI